MRRAIMPKILYREGQVLSLIAPLWYNEMADREATGCLQENLESEAYHDEKIYVNLAGNVVIRRAAAGWLQRKQRSETGGTTAVSGQITKSILS